MMNTTNEKTIRICAAVLAGLLALAGPLWLGAQTAPATDTTIFKTVEEMPRFPGCEHPDSSLVARRKCAEQRLLDYIYRRIVYPAEAREQGLEGTVVITFVVEKDGSLSNAAVVRDIGGGAGAAALRLLEAMQRDGVRWIPGRQGGQPVRVQFNLPVRFKLEEPLPYAFNGRDTIYIEFDQALDFKGGAEALQAYLADRLKYPAIGNDSCRMGQVDVQLLVRADNTVGILNITDYNNLGFDFWYEAIDACTSTYGRWTPARYQGRPVNAALDVSLAFSPTAPACQTVVEQYGRASDLAEEGATLYNEEKTEEGLAKMSEALALFPRDGKLLLLRGQAYLDLNRLEEACKDLQLARRITLVDWYNGVLQLCR